MVIFPEGARDLDQLPRPRLSPVVALGLLTVLVSLGLIALLPQVPILTGVVFCQLIAVLASAVALSVRFTLTKHEHQLNVNLDAQGLTLLPVAWIWRWCRRVSGLLVITAITAAAALVCEMTVNASSLRRVTALLFIVGSCGLVAGATGLVRTARAQHNSGMRLTSEGVIAQAGRQHQKHLWQHVPVFSLSLDGHPTLTVSTVHGVGSSRLDLRLLDCDPALVLALCQYLTRKPHLWQRIDDAAFMRHLLSSGDFLTSRVRREVDHALARAERQIQSRRADHPILRTGRIAAGGLVRFAGLIAVAGGLARFSTSDYSTNDLLVLLTFVIAGAVLWAVGSVIRPWK